MIDLRPEEEACYICTLQLHEIESMRAVGIRIDQETRRSRLSDGCPMAVLKPGDSAVLLVGALGELLRTEEYQLVAPTVRDGAIVH
jgi:hypothetical protein